MLKARSEIKTRFPHTLAPGKIPCLYMAYKHASYINKKPEAIKFAGKIPVKFCATAAIWTVSLVASMREELNLHDS